MALGKSKKSQRNGVTGKPLYTYTTPCGYKYQYLVDEIIPGSELANTLDEAVSYKKVISFNISDEHLEHIKKKLDIVCCNEQDKEYHFYWKLQEGTINILDDHTTNYRNTIILFLAKKSIEKKLFNKYFKHLPMVRVGLHLFLDPNYGGAIDDERIELANLIMFG